MAKLCPKCGSTKADSEFYIRQNGNLQSWCIACIKKLRVERNPEIAAYQRRKRKERTGFEKKLEKDYQLRYHFGITLEEYEVMLEVQEHCCAVCGKEDGADLYSGERTKQLSVDHCHKTGFNRGLLCNDCNRAIGQLKDDPALLRKAAEYLEQWAKKHLESSSTQEKLAEKLFGELDKL